MLNGFGQKVRDLREGLHITREEFCGDETELSIRQLARIESGQSIPTLAKVEYIAKSLNTTIGSLIDEGEMVLPKRYKELKYQILRIPTYMNNDYIQLREKQFDEIAEQFYYDLPEEEQMVMDALQARFDVHLSNDISFCDCILNDYFEQVKKKSQFSINDLIVIDLYVLQVKHSIRRGNFKEEMFLNCLVKKLITHQEKLDSEGLYVLNNVLIRCCDCYFINKDISTIDKIIKTCKMIMTKVQDFQKSPVISLLEWKFNLFLKDNIIKAKECYKNAIMFSKMMGDDLLAEKLQEEWEKDTIT